MPYYIASLNIEHAYHERPASTTHLRDCASRTRSISLKRHRCPSSPRRTASESSGRRGAKITVIIGNPPYNVGQLNENDNNKNRSYDEIDDRIKETYSKGLSRHAQEQAQRRLRQILPLGDRPAQRARRDRLLRERTTASSISTRSTACASTCCRTSTCIYHIDLHGNVRKNPEAERHHAQRVRHPGRRGDHDRGTQEGRGHTTLRYYRVPEFWRKEEKLAFLNDGTITWDTLTPDTNHNVAALRRTRNSSKSSRPIQTIFDIHSLGAGTNRDEWVYDFDQHSLTEKVKRLIKNYNFELARLQAEDPPPDDIDEFVNTAPDFMKWTDRLKSALLAGDRLKFNAALIGGACTDRSLPSTCISTHCLCIGGIDSTSSSRHRIGSGEPSYCDDESRALRSRSFR